jgi:AsmA protein
MKRAAIIVVLAAAALAIVVAALPFVVPGSFLRERMADSLTRLTGRTVAINGETALSIYPHVALTANALTVANRRGMGDDPFLAAETTSARLRLVPLLIGRIEFEEISLVKPRIHLVTDNNGRSNWRPPGEARVRVAGQPATGAGIPGTWPSLVRITNGTIVYDNLASDRREEMAGVDLEVNWPRANLAASVRGTTQWRGESVDFNASATQPGDLLRGGTSAVRFSLAATPLRIQFNGKATGDGNLLGPLTLAGDATVATPSMRRTIEWLGTPIGAGSILGTASIGGHVGWAGATVTFDQATVELDGNSATGTLSASFAGARPNVTAALALDSLDLSPYLESIRADVGAEGSWVISPARIPFADALDAEIDLAAAQVMLGEIRIGRTSATMSVKSGALSLDVRNARFYGGQLEARIGARMDGDALAGKAQVTLSDVPAQLALADLAGVASLDGATDATLDLATRGRIWGEVVHDIAGIGQIHLTGGTVRGFDLPAIARHFADPLAEPVEAGSGSTAFTTLAAGLVVGDGTLHTDNLVMHGKDFVLNLAGRGSVLSGAVNARATLTTGRMDLPLAVTGTWREAVVDRDEDALRPSLDTPDKSTAEDATHPSP